MNPATTPLTESACIALIPDVSNKKTITAWLKTAFVNLRKRGISNPTGEELEEEGEGRRTKGGEVSGMRRGRDGERATEPPCSTNAKLTHTPRQLWKKGRPESMMFIRKVLSPGKEGKRSRDESEGEESGEESGEEGHVEKKARGEEGGEAMEGVEVSGAAEEGE